MIKRKGFKKFHQRLRGEEPKEEPMKETKFREYALPTELTNPDLLRAEYFNMDDPTWVDSLFIWNSSEQGDFFWEQIYDGEGNRELALEILLSWQRQLGYDQA